MEACSLCLTVSRCLHTPYSAQQIGTDSTGGGKPVLPERTTEQLGKTKSRMPLFSGQISWSKWNLQDEVRNLGGGDRCEVAPGQPGVAQGELLWKGGGPNSGGEGGGDSIPGATTDHSGGEIDAVVPAQQQ